MCLLPVIVQDAQVSSFDEVTQDKQEDESYLQYECILSYLITFRFEMLREKSSAVKHYQYLKVGLLLTLCTTLNFLEQISVIYDGEKKKKPKQEKTIKKVLEVK